MTKPYFKPSAREIDNNQALASHASAQIKKPTTTNLSYPRLERHIASSLDLARLLYHKCQIEYRYGKWMFRWVETSNDARVLKKENWHYVRGFVMANRDIYDNGGEINIGSVWTPRYGNVYVLNKPISIQGYKYAGWSDWVDLQYILLHQEEIAWNALVLVRKEEKVFSVFKCSKPSARLTTAQVNRRKPKKKNGTKPYVPKHKREEGAARKQTDLLRSLKF